MAVFAPYFLGVMTAPLAAKIVKPILRGVVKTTVATAMQVKKAAAEASMQVKQAAAEAGAEFKDISAEVGTASRSTKVARVDVVSGVDV